MYSTIDSHVQEEYLKIWATVSVSVAEWAPSSTSSKVSALNMATCYGRRMSKFLMCSILLGMINAPRRQRIWSGLCLVRNRAPFLGGSFGLWGGLFSSFDCMLIHYRQKDDPYNAMIAGFLTGGVLQIRAGVQQAFKQALIGGFIIMLIEGVSNIFTAIATRRQHEMMQQMYKQELERQKAMMARGGDNPWEVNYDEKLAKN